MKTFVGKGNLCFSRSMDELVCMEHSYIVVEDGRVAGVFRTLPERYAQLPVLDYGEQLILPGMTDLHVHAPQFAFRGLGMDMELLEWLNTYTFPEESKYKELEYADRAYRALWSICCTAQPRARPFSPPSMCPPRSFLCRSWMKRGFRATSERST